MARSTTRHSYTWSRAFYRHRWPPSSTGKVEIPVGVERRGAAYLYEAGETFYPLGMAIEQVFLDFGGCIDAPGIHTRTLFWEAFAGTAGLPEREVFQEAYTQADRRMMETGEAKDLGLAAFNRHNASLIAGTLGLPAAAALMAGDLVTARMDGYLDASGRALRELAKSYPLHLISNFTGNLERILEEKRLRSLFESVTESFHAGVSKPAAAIFTIALSRQASAPESCVYVGDNPANDIVPARAAGMRAVLIHEPGKRRECGADGYVSDLRELEALIQSM